MKKEKLGRMESGMNFGFYVLRLLCWHMKALGSVGSGFSGKHRYRS